MKNLKALFVIAFVSLSLGSFAQCDPVAELCSKHITDGFISDGQSYRSLLIDNQMAEFHSTFYGNTTYRVAACSGKSDGNLIFRIYDDERNLIFTNADFRNAPYWNFEVKNTLDCIIECQLDGASSASGCAVLLIGFQQ